MRETAGFRWVRRIGLTLLTVFVSGPLYVMAIGSLSPSTRDFQWWPRRVSFAPYRKVWSTIPLARYLENSAIVAAASAGIAVVVAVPAAYAMARHRFAGRAVIGSVVLATQFVPGLVFLLPLFLTYSEVYRATGVQLVGSYTGLILTDLTFALPFAIWLLIGYLGALPVDAEEAAQVDGAGTLTLLTRIVVPAAAPGIVAVAIFAFGLSWGEVLFASVLTDDRTTTLPIGLPTLASQSGEYWNQLLAASLMSALPVVLAFLALRRFLIPGLLREASRTANHV